MPPSPHPSLLCHPEEGDIASPPVIPTEGAKRTSGGISSFLFPLRLSDPRELRERIPRAGGGAFFPAPFCKSDPCFSPARKSLRAGGSHLSSILFHLTFTRPSAEPRFNEYRDPLGVKLILSPFQVTVSEGVVHSATTSKRAVFQVFEVFRRLESQALPWPSGPLDDGKYQKVGRLRPRGCFDPGVFRVMPVGRNEKV